MKKNSWLVVLLLFFWSKNFGQNDTGKDGILSLQQCVETAIRNNMDVKRFEYQMMSDKSNLQQAKGNMLPTLNGSISHGINEGRSIDPFTNGYVDQQVNFANYGLNTSISLWNGSAIKNNIRQNALNYEAGKMDVQQQKDQLTIQVMLSYLQVLTNEEQVGMAANQVAVAKQQVARLNKLNDEGAIAPSTLYDLKGEVANDELSVVNINNSLASARLSLAQWMNIPYNEQLQLAKLDASAAPVIYDGTIDQIYRQAEQNLAIVKAADLHYKTAQMGVKTALSQQFPLLSINGGVGTNYSSAASMSKLIGTQEITTDQYIKMDNGKLPVYALQNNYNSQQISYGDQWKNNFNSYISLGLQIPILNGLQSKNRIKQARILEKQTSFQSETIKIQLKQTIEQAYVNLKSAYQRYQILTAQVEDFNMSFKAAEVKFNAGASTSVDYLVAKNNLDRANMNLIAAKYDYILRTKILDFYQGKQLW